MSQHIMILFSNDFPFGAFNLQRKVISDDAIQDNLKNLCIRSCFASFLAQSVSHLVT